MDQTEWEKELKEDMISKGLTCDRDDEYYLGFSYIEGENEWIKDYNKKARRFVQLNGNQRIKLYHTKDENE